jgi:LytR cell envelope-related transcriptional attenuator
MSATRPPAFDDRFTTPIEASRRGAHRARPKPVSATLPVLAGIAVVLLVVGGVYAVLNGTNESSGSTVAAAEDPGPSASAGVGAAVPTKGSQATQTPQTSAPTSEAATGADVNRGVNLVVLNSVPVKGLAAKVKTKLEGAGWSVSRTGNSNNKNLPTSKVYYAKSSLKSTAEAMVKDLGYGEVSKDAVVAKAGLVVVLGQDAAR